MTKAVVRGLMLASIAFALVLLPDMALAQSGSAGGSIGNDDTSLSGKRETPRSIEPEERPSRRASPPAKEARPPARSRTTSTPAAPKAQPNPQGLIRMGGVGTVVSDGNCKCKSNCRTATPLNPALTAQCMQSCENTYSGCNKGLPR
jgi:hypothetical protein